MYALICWCFEYLLWDCRAPSRPGESFVAPNRPNEWPEQRPWSAQRGVGGDAVSRVGTVSCAASSRLTVSSVDFLDKSILQMEWSTGNVIYDSGWGELPENMYSRLLYMLFMPSFAGKNWPTISILIPNNLNVHTFSQWSQNTLWARRLISQSKMCSTEMLKKCLKFQVESASWAMKKIFGNANVMKSKGLMAMKNFFGISNYYLLLAMMLFMITRMMFFQMMCFTIKERI